MGEERVLRHAEREAVVDPLPQQEPRHRVTGLRRDDLAAREEREEPPDVARGRRVPAGLARTHDAVPEAEARDGRVHLVRAEELDERRRRLVVAPIDHRFEALAHRHRLEGVVDLAGGQARPADRHGRLEELRIVERATVERSHDEELEERRRLDTLVGAPLVHVPAVQIDDHDADHAGHAGRRLIERGGEVGLGIPGHRGHEGR